MSEELPQDLEEEYYQINRDILQSFNKFRPPLNIYRFREDVSRVLSYYRMGDRLSKEQTEELAEMVDQGVIFVSREDHSVYVKHISHQLDLVLLDKHLLEHEIADIFQIALTRRMQAFFEQPVKVVYDKVQEDIFTLTEYLWQDFSRIKALARRRHHAHSLANHSVNSGFMGLLLFMQRLPGDFNQEPKNRQTFDRTALGMFLHDMGMSKVPAFIRDKTKPLTPDERQKIQTHTLSGYEMIARLDIKYPEVENCVNHHHERVDGSGYPQRLSGPGISDVGLVCGVADSFCAMTSDRPYAKAMDPMAAAKALCDDARRYPSETTKHLLSHLVNEKR
ncbi:HD-GYP domain-containing protein [Desulfolutivibrio sulfoxidireducens]|uniref:HD-GYP domain-containing protein n=1 Tax=Desulfolutivibrio sulfoxidireducens TaxID=2773299 RepID=UPI00159DF92B|nr:HD domain-containing phosphohydrolase [Desulfolutivibrio sulfoxidireducens]QLA17207.1 HD domain-containing protein [Desulfolutivibrio sulfoxidireducens]QLA20776.1 HD domain-containing protein [Desulfolutivibrio sulfoxidireducens]